MLSSPALQRARRPLAAAALAVLACPLSLALHAAPLAGGKPATLEGRVEVRIEDYANHTSRTRTFLQTEHGRVELRFKHAPAGLVAGARVRVQGTGSSDGTALELGDTSSTTVETVAAASSTAVLGQHRVAVILVNFVDDTSQPITLAAAKTLVFSNVDAYYRENSFQQAWLTGDGYGWVNIAASKTACNTDAIATQADQAATAAGANLSGYDRIVYMFPKNACTWSGLAVSGSAPARAWINGSFILRTVAHELGHTFGLLHAHGLDCDTGALGATCTTLTYGDITDMMGTRTGQFNPFEKEKLGWLNDGVSPPILSASSNGRYTIEPYAASSVGPKAVKIPRTPDPTTGKPRWYYVEYRQPVGADAPLATVGNVTKGVLLRTATEGDANSSYLLDMTPNTNVDDGFADLEDGALLVGQSYTDAASGVTISLASAGSSGASIDVSFGGGTPPAPTCTRAAPALAISGATTAVAAGTTRSYTVSVTNQDSSACAATSFALARSVPTGWTGTLGATSLSLSPGASGTTTLSVTSPTSAGAGSYGIGVGASSSAGSVHTANASSTYSVSAPATLALTETVGTDKTSYLRGETVYMSALVRNNGVAFPGAAVRFTVTLPGGTTTVVNATSGSDGYARATYKLGKAKSAIGSYGVRADASSGSATANASTSFQAR